MRQQLGNAGKQNASLIIRMLPPFVTCYDERGISTPEIHLHSFDLNHCSRSCADRLPSAGRSDSTEDKLKKTTVSIISIKLFMCVCTQYIPSLRWQTGKYMRYFRGNSHLPVLLLLHSCYTLCLFTNELQWTAQNNPTNNKNALLKQDP